MASRILAQLLVAGVTTLARASTQAWQQALRNAQQSGVAQEAVKGAVRTGQMPLDEAQKILRVADGAPWAEVVKRYKHMFDVNDKYGSHYLLSKVYRAGEKLEEEYTAQGLRGQDDVSIVQGTLEKEAAGQPGAQQKQEE